MPDIATLAAKLETQLFIAQLFTLLASTAFYAAFKDRVFGRVSWALSLLLLLGSIAARVAESGRMPFATMYEFGLLLELVVLALVLAMDLRFESAAPAVALAGTAFALAFIQLLLFQEAKPLMPALKSWWLGAHVLTAVIAYGLIAASAALSVVGLARKRAPEGVEAMVVRLARIAFPFLTLLIITGAVWAEYAWGAFWRWDPKETWALITWLAYLSFLHLTSARGWKGRRVLWLSIAGFLIVVFTFFGVNFLLAGLHSYA